MFRLPILKETVLSDVKTSQRSQQGVCPQPSGLLDPSVTWASVDTERIEMQTYYEPRCFLMTMVGEEEEDDNGNSVRERLQQESNETAAVVSSTPLSFSNQYAIPVIFRSHTSLPLSDAVDLLMGIDHTGLMAWEGSRQLLKWLGMVLRARLVEEEKREGEEEGTKAATGTTEFDDTANTKQTISSTTVVELGAGCGFLSVAIVAMLDAFYALTRGNRNAVVLPHQHCTTNFVEKLGRRVLFPPLRALSSSFPLGHRHHICVTDGNDECVDLSLKNLQLHASLRDKVNYKHRLTSERQEKSLLKSASDFSSQTDFTSRVFWWGEEKTAKEIVNWEKSGEEHSTSTSTSASSLLLIAGDVVYGMEAVEPLVKGAMDLAKAFVEKNKSMSHTAVASDGVNNDAVGNDIMWVLSWMPRCLTIPQNLLLFEALLKETTKRTADGGSGWKISQVFIRQQQKEKDDKDREGTSLNVMEVLADPFHTLLSEASSRDDVLFRHCAMEGCIICLEWAEGLI